MLVYNKTKADFLRDVSDKNIEEVVMAWVKDKLGINVGNSERNSWRSSLKEMYFVMDDNGIPDDAGVAIEYRIPQTSKRIDFIITGASEDKTEQVIIIELKQWSEVELTSQDGIVITRFYRSKHETPHPSYQAWSYAELLNEFNQTVYEEQIKLHPCAYLHNFLDDSVINDAFYADYIKEAPLFLKNDKVKLRDFIKKYVKYGDTSQTMYRIDSGKIKPSKSLAASLASMLKGNREFVMIDDQKIVFEKAMVLAKESSVSASNVLVVEGGPGTGKSVVAINILVALTKKEMVAHYVTKNAAPRSVYEAMLKRDFRKSVISNLFTGPGTFRDTAENEVDVLIVDEAHRLNEKGGLFGNLGINQIKELIASAKFCVFFIDEDQKVTWRDIGTIDEIEKWAGIQNASLYKLELSSQFRCNGSDGYLAWLDNMLGIRETANYFLEQRDFDFRVFDSPNEMRELINEKNKINNKARIVAGYCWNWISKKNPQAMDIAIPEHDFEMQWNLTSHGGLWLIKPESVTEAGCIHTCQGLELDYVGVIVGDDFVIRDGRVVTNPAKRARTDQSLKGYKNALEENKSAAQKKADLIIKNTYRTLMTRGMKGCYVYFTDKETGEYFKKHLNQ